jgi:hypothetical protein
MSPEVLFAAFNIAIIPFWLLLILAPKWIWTDRIVHSIWVPIASAIWALTLGLSSPAAPDGASMRTLPGVMLLIDGAHGTLTVWTLLMCWDLLAGAWLSRDARRLKIHHAWVVASLLVTFVFGIPGLLLYIVIRVFQRRTFTMQEA